MSERPPSIFITEGGGETDGGQAVELYKDIPVALSKSNILDRISSFPRKLLSRRSANTTSVSPEILEEINALQREMRIKQFIADQREVNPNFLIPRSETTTLAD